MKLFLKTRLYLLVIAAVVLTASITSIAFIVIVFQQAETTHARKLEIAQSGFQDRFQQLHTELEQSFSSIQNNRKPESRP